MTPYPSIILDRCRRLGLKLWAEGDRIGIAPKGRIPPDLREQIRAAKSELLPVLRNATALRPDEIPWLYIARQILAGEFDGADGCTVESLVIGLRGFAHPVCHHALKRLRVQQSKSFTP